MGKHNDVAHRPCLLAETLSFLSLRDGGAYADLTVGHGYMASALLEACSPSGRLLAVDLDPLAVEAARARLARFGDRCCVVQGSYEDLRELADQTGFTEFEAIVIDAGGVSTEQLRSPEKGLSFAVPAPLRMKLDPSRPGPSAADLVNTLSPSELARLFRTVGESARTARGIASAIVSSRKQQPITTTTELARLVERVVGSSGTRRGQVHPATRVFLGLRLAVNRELPALERGIGEAVKCLRPGARLVVLSYHGLEHRLVRRLLRDMEHGCVCPPGLPVCGCGRQPLVRRLLAKPLSPSAREIAFNPSARSARLHCVTRSSAPM